MARDGVKEGTSECYDTTNSFGLFRLDIDSAVLLKCRHNPGVWRNGLGVREWMGERCL